MFICKNLLLRKTVLFLKELAVEMKEFKKLKYG